MKTPISKVEIVGYEVPFAEEEGVVGRLTPWFRRKEPKEGDKYLLPPFTITKATVVGGYFVDDDTIEALCHRKEGILLDRPFAGRPGHTLWMNEEGKVGYNDRDRVRADLGNYALRQIAEAWRKVIGGELEEALGCVGCALSADGSMPDVWIAKGVVERLMKDDWECESTLEAAAAKFGSSVADRVDEYVQRVDEYVQRVKNAAATNPRIAGHAKQLAPMPAPLRGNSERFVVEALLDEDEDVAGHLVESAHGITGEEEVKESFRALGAAVARRNGERGKEGALGALLCIRREGEKRARKNGRWTRLYFAWMLQGLTAWYAEHSWGGVDRMVSALTGANDGLVSATRDVVETFQGRGWALVVGWTPWVEARLLASVGKELLRGVKGASGKMRVYQTDHPLKWGKDLWNGYGEEADVSFVNECMLDETKSKRQKRPEIFQFQGYYVFARRAYIEGAAPANVDERVELAARGKLRYLRGSDFARVVGAIEKRVGANGNGASAEAEIENRSELDKEFQRFINGETKVFLGGAHHAALLREWWMPGKEAPVDVLLEPPEVQELMDDERVFANRVIFAEWLRRGQGKKGAREALATFFAEVWRALCTVLENGKREEMDSVAGPLLRYVYEGVAERVSAREERPWSFLTHREQLQWICTRDSPAVRLADSGGSAGRQDGRSVRRGGGKGEQKPGGHGASGQDGKVVSIRSGRR